MECLVSIWFRLRLHQPPLHRRLQDAGAGLLEFGLDALQGGDGLVEAGKVKVDVCDGCFLLFQ